MSDIAGSRDDKKLRIFAPQLAHDAFGKNRFVHGKDHGKRVFDTKVVQRIAPRGIAKGRSIAFSLGIFDEVCI